jgi:hypothetical protein
MGKQDFKVNIEPRLSGKETDSFRKGTLNRSPSKLGLEESTINANIVSYTKVVDDITLEKIDLSYMLE